jgi:hypothetical protein
MNGLCKCATCETKSILDAGGFQLHDKTFWNHSNALISFLYAYILLLFLSFWILFFRRDALIVISCVVIMQRYLTDN